jgi:hypothetical protein
MQIHSRYLTITVDHTSDKDTVKRTGESQQAHISMFANDMNHYRICCFSRGQNYTRKLCTKVFNWVEVLSEAHEYVSLELHCKNNVIILQINEN